jgi:hypothetical protein
VEYTIEISIVTYIGSAISHPASIAQTTGMSTVFYIPPPSKGIGSPPGNHQ